MQTRFPPPTDPWHPARLGLAFLLTGSALIFTVTIAFRLYSVLDASKQHRLDRIHQSILTRADYLKTTQAYEACIVETTQIPASSLVYSPAKTLQDQCQLGLDEATLSKAQTLANSGHLKEAIAELQTVSTRNSIKVKQLTEEWSNRILQIAEEHYTAPNASLPKAIQVASMLRSNNPFYVEAQIKIRRWQTEWVANQQRWQAAQAALNTNQPEMALLEVQQMTHPYWSQQSASIVNAAYAEIALLNQAKVAQSNASTQVSTAAPLRSEPESVPTRVDVEIDVTALPDKLLLPFTVGTLLLLGHRLTT